MFRSVQSLAMGAPTPSRAMAALGSLLLVTWLGACETLPPLPQPAQAPPTEATPAAAAEEAQPAEQAPPTVAVEVEEPPPPTAPEGPAVVVNQAALGALEATVTTAELPLPPLGGVQVALLVPLSGPTGRVGQALLNAAQLALFDTAGEELVLLPKDTGASAEDAQAAASAAIAEGADVVLGPLFSGSVQVAAPLTREAGLSMIAFSNDRKVAGEGVYLLGVTPAQQVERVVAHAHANGLGRIAALVPENDYGSAVVSALFESAAANGVQVATVEFFSPQAADLTEPVGRLARAAGGRTPDSRAFDALLVATGGAQLRAIAPLLAYFDFDVRGIRLLGLQGWHDPAVLGEPALLGAWFAAPPSELWQGFERKYGRLFGEPPPRVAALAYDAVALAAALARTPGGPDFSGEALSAASGFEGAEGLFRFRPDGVAERGLAMFEVTEGGFRVVSEAPAAFPVPTL